MILTIYLHGIIVSPFENMTFDMLRNTRIQDLNKFDKISMCCFSNQGRPKKTAI